MIKVVLFWNMFRSTNTFGKQIQKIHLCNNSENKIITYLQWRSPFFLFFFLFFFCFFFCCVDFLFSATQLATTLSFSYLFLHKNTFYTIFLPCFFTTVADRYITANSQSFVNAIFIIVVRVQIFYGIYLDSLLCDELQGSIFF